MLALNRTIHKGMKGPDVLGLKRALVKSGHKQGIRLNESFGLACDRQLRTFQKHSGLLVDGVLGQKTMNKLEEYVDDYGRALFKQAPKPDPKAEAFARFLSYMELMTRETAGYGWGSGHGIPIKDVRIDGKLDCSSSTSKALWHEGWFSAKYALISGEFISWGMPGKGEYFTVWCNQGHVWIQTHKGPYDRFDTSPHGDGGRGPRLRKLPRFTTGFTPRHWPGF